LVGSVLGVVGLLGVLENRLLYGFVRNYGIVNAFLVTFWSVDRKTVSLHR